MTTIKNYQLEKMSAKELTSLWKSIKSVYTRHFDTPIQDDYLNKKCKNAVVARLRVIWNGADAVGIMVLFGYKLKLNGHKSIVYRGSGAIDKGYRNKNNLSNFLFYNVLPQIIRYRGYAQYIIEGFIHPSSFCISQKAVQKIYPSPNMNTPSKILNLMETVKEQGLLGGYEFEDEHPFLGTYPCNVVQSSRENKRWENKIAIDEYTEFFYQLGAMKENKAIICIVPLSVSNFVLSIVKSGKERLRQLFLKKNNLVMRRNYNHS
ncbi:hypothetical protein [Aureispira sp. CCB-QB1]|uniref:hypothetical protein n=1 Tax=Aureispira sp. CCB-QB1 TaxID=1313421 RepID=UPI00069921EB|nr:hypothetical protein [Aureispira sp. CCB-QB1]